MTVPVTPGLQVFTTDGVTSTFDFDFKIFSPADLQVFVNGAQRTLGPDYTVDFDTDDDGGTVTFSVVYAAPADTTTPNGLIRRVLPYDQQTDLPLEGPFPIEAVQNIVDKLTMLAQQLKESLDRAIQRDPTDLNTDPLYLPAPEEGHALVWEDGVLANTVENLAGITETSLQAAEDAETAADAAETAAAAAAVSANAAANAAVAVGGLEDKGDLLTSVGGGNPGILPVGPNGYVLTVDETNPRGISWQEGIPVGSITYYAGITVPTGWRRCDGGDSSRTLESALFNVIGTRYGAGDGSTTFGRPDLDPLVDGAVNLYPIIKTGTYVPTSGGGSTPSVLLAWWDCQEPGKVTLDSTLGYPVVTKWIDKLQGIELDALSLAQAPLWIASSNMTSGRPAISFDGVDDCLQTMGLNNLLSGVAGVSASMLLRTFPSATNTLDRVIWLEAGTGGGKPRFGYARSGFAPDEFYMDGATLDTDSYAFVTGSVYPYDGWGVHSARRDFASGLARVDFNSGLVAAGTNIPTVGLGDTAPATRFRLGMENGGTNPGQFYIHSLKLYSGSISDTIVAADNVALGGLISA